MDEPTPFTCPDPEIRVYLKELSIYQKGMSKDLKDILAEAKHSNGRVSDIELDIALTKAREEQRKEDDAIFRSIRERSYNLRVTLAVIITPVLAIGGSQLLELLIR